MKIRFALGLVILALWVGLSATASEQRLAMVLEVDGGVTVRAAGQNFNARALQILPAGAEISIATGGKVRLSYLQTRQKETILGPSKVKLEEGGARKLEGQGSVDREAGAGIEVMSPKDAKIRRAGGKLQAHLMPQPVAMKVAVATLEDKKPVNTEEEAGDEASPPPQAPPPGKPPAPTTAYQYDTRAGGGAAAPPPIPQVGLGESTVFSRGEFVMAHPSMAGPYKVTISKAGKTYYQGPSLRPGKALAPGTYTLKVASGIARGQLEFTVLDQATAQRLAALKNRAKSRDQRLEVLATLMEYGLLEEAIDYNARLVKDYPEPDLTNNLAVLRRMVKPK